MEYAIEVASCDMIYIPGFLKIGADVKAILRLFLRNLRFCNVGITGERDL
jgi:hypothetical protein